MNNSHTICTTILTCYYRTYTIPFFHSINDIANIHFAMSIEHAFTDMFAEDVCIVAIFCDSDNEIFEVLPVFLKDVQTHALFNFQRWWRIRDLTRSRRRKVESRKRHKTFRLCYNRWKKDFLCANENSKSHFESICIFINSNKDLERYIFLFLHKLIHY